VISVIAGLFSLRCRLAAGLDRTDGSNPGELRRHCTPVVVRSLPPREDCLPVPSIQRLDPRSRKAGIPFFSSRTAMYSCCCCVRPHVDGRSQRDDCDEAILGHSQFVLSLDRALPLDILPCFPAFVFCLPANRHRWGQR